MAVRRFNPLLLGTLTMLLGVAGVSAPLRAEGEPGAAVAHGTRGRALLELANAQRAKAGVPPLRTDARLMQAAQTQAEQSAAARRLQHVLPNARYPRPEDRLDASGYPWRAWGENLAVGHKTPSDAIAAWMRSPSHRRNLLNPKYTELGIGLAVDAAGRPYYVQVFGRRLEARARADAGGLYVSR